METLDTQGKIVKAHLERNGSITSMEAFRKYNITRISAIIYTLRHSGMKIETERVNKKNKEGKVMNYGIYHLVKEK